MAHAVEVISIEAFSDLLEGCQQSEDVPAAGVRMRRIVKSDGTVLLAFQAPDGDSFNLIRIAE